MPDVTPFVSVVIPVFNDPEGIITTLQSVTTQTYPRDRYEVLVVDNGSSDETLAVTEEFAQQSEGLVQVLQENTIQSSYAARNRGIEQSTGEVIAFIDANMSVNEGWLDSVVEEMASRDLTIVGCDVEVYIPKGEKTTFATYNQLFDLPVEDLIAQHSVIPTCCLTVRRWIFDEFGMFDPYLISGGDGEFSNRLSEAGIDPHYLSSVSMYHPARTSCSETLHKQIRLGRGFEQCQQRYPERIDLPNLVNPIIYLPPTPWHFHSRYKRRARKYGIHTSFSQFFIFYIITYVNILSRAIGRIYEWSSVRKEKP